MEHEAKSTCATKGGSVSKAPAQKKRGGTGFCPQCLLLSCIDCMEAGCQHPAVLLMLAFVAVLEKRKGAAFP